MRIFKQLSQISRRTFVQGLGGTAAKTLVPYTPRKIAAEAAKVFTGNPKLLSGIGHALSEISQSRSLWHRQTLEFMNSLKDKEDANTLVDLDLFGLTQNVFGQIPYLMAMKFIDLEAIPVSSLQTLFADDKDHPFSKNPSRLTSLHQSLKDKKRLDYEISSRLQTLDLLIQGAVSKAIEQGQDIEHFNRSMSQLRLSSCNLEDEFMELSLESPLSPGTTINSADALVSYSLDDLKFLLEQEFASRFGFRAEIFEISSERAKFLDHFTEHPIVRAFHSHQNGPDLSLRGLSEKDSDFADHFRGAFNDIADYLGEERELILKPDTLDIADDIETFTKKIEQQMEKKETEQAIEEAQEDILERRYICEEYPCRLHDEQNSDRADVGLLENGAGYMLTPEDENEWLYPEDLEALTKYLNEKLESRVQIIPEKGHPEETLDYEVYEAFNIFIDPYAPLEDYRILDRWADQYDFDESELYPELQPQSAAA